MARIEPKNGKYKLGGSKDTDIEGIDDKKYNLFTDEEKLAVAKIEFPNINWFASYTIKDKDGKDVHELPAYTIKFAKPSSDEFKFYYYLNGATILVPHQKDNANRVKATLSIGDPPVGTWP